MGRIKDTNYYVTNGWMINQLGLSGRELQIYAIIYGFTQDGETEFNGSLTYLMEWLNVNSKHTVIKAIDGLIQKGLVEKRQIMTPKGPVNYYTATTKLGGAENAPEQCKKCTGDSAENALGGSAENAPNNNKDKDLNNYKDIPFEEIRNLYNEICKSLPRCLKLTDNRKKHIAARWKEYGGDLETFVRLFTKAEASSFLTGKNDRGWMASFDWLLKPDKMVNVLEGKHDNKGGGNNAAKRNNQGTEKPRLSTAEYAKKLADEGQLPTVPDFNELFAAH